MQEKGEYRKLWFSNSFRYSRDSDVNFSLHSAPQYICLTVSLCHTVSNEENIRYWRINLRAFQVGLSVVHSATQYTGLCVSVCLSLSIPPFQINSSVLLFSRP